jgi:hypothetical protein
MSFKGLKRIWKCRSGYRRCALRDCAAGEDRGEVVREKRMSNRQDCANGPCYIQSTIAASRAALAEAGGNYTRLSSQPIAILAFFRCPFHETPHRQDVFRIYSGYPTLKASWQIRGKFGGGPAEEYFLLRPRILRLRTSKPAIDSICSPPEFIFNFRIPLST